MLYSRTLKHEGLVFRLWLGLRGFRQCLRRHVTLSLSLYRFHSKIPWIQLASAASDLSDKYT
jgi:hypothetical protein